MMDNQISNKGLLGAVILFLIIWQNSKNVFIHGRPMMAGASSEGIARRWKFLENFIQTHLTHCHTFFIGVSEDWNQVAGNLTHSPPTESKLNEIIQKLFNTNSKFSTEIEPAWTAMLLILEKPSKTPETDLNVTDDTTILPKPGKVPPKFLPATTFEDKHKWRNGLKKFTEFCTTIIFMSDRMTTAESESEAKPIVIQNEIEREHKGRGPMDGQGFLSKIGLTCILNPRFYPLIKMDEDYFIFIGEKIFFFPQKEHNEKEKFIEDSINVMETHLVPTEISKALLFLMISYSSTGGNGGENFAQNFGGGEEEIILKKNCLLCPDSFYLKIKHGEKMSDAEFPQNVAGTLGWTKLGHFFPKTILQLRGRILKVSVTTGIPSRISLAKIDPQLLMMTQEDKIIDKKYDMTRGMYNYVLREFSKKLNFTILPFPSSPRGASRPGGSGNVQKDGTWSGVIGDVFNYRADFGFLCGETVTRYSFTELAGVIEIIFLTFTTGKQSQFYSWKAIFWPYETKVWICCCVSFFFASILLYAVQKLENNDNTKKSTYVSTGRGTTRVTSNDTFLDCVEFVIFSFFEAPTDLRGVGRMKVQLISSFWCIFGVVLATVYRGSLTSLLAFPQYERTPRDFAELAESDYKVALQHYGGSAYEQITYSPNPALVKIRQTMILEPSPYKCYKLVQDQKFGCIDYGTFGDYVILLNFTKNNGRSDLNMQHTRDYFLPVGPMFRRRSYLMESFRWAIGKVFDAGLTDRWIKMDYEDVRKKMMREAKLTHPDAKRQHEDDKVILLTLKNFTGAFTIFFVGLAGGLLLFTGEWMSILFFYVADNLRIKMEEGRREITESAKWRRISRTKQQTVETTTMTTTTTTAQEFDLTVLGVPEPKTKKKKKKGAVAGPKISIQMATTKFIAEGHVHRKNFNLTLKRPSNNNPHIYATDEFGRSTTSSSSQMPSSAPAVPGMGGLGGEWRGEDQNKERQGIMITIIP